MTNSQSVPTNGGSTDSLQQCMVAMEENADHAVALLHLGDFIRNNKRAIYGQLEQIDVRVSEAAQGRTLGLKSDADFIAQSLPLASGVIGVGSNRKNIEDATAWVKEERPNADPIPLLSTLTLVYIVKQARDDARKEAEKEAAKQAGVSPTASVQGQTVGQEEKTRWEGIYKRLQWLCEK